MRVGASCAHCGGSFTSMCIISVRLGREYVGASDVLRCRAARHVCSGAMPCANKSVCDRWVQYMRSRARDGRPCDRGVAKLARRNESQ